MSYPFPFQIRSVGRYLPERVVRNDELEQRMGLKPGWIEKKTGVIERRWADDDMSASFMAARAIEDALERAEMKLDDISLIINASGTPQRVIPDNAVRLLRQEQMRQLGKLLTGKSGGATSPRPQHQKSGDTA